MVLNKKQKKKLAKVLTALHELKSGDRNEKHGICNNLYFKVDSTDLVEQFIAYSFELKYGEPDILYPIEGDRRLHYSDNGKWDENTVNGAARLKLLDFMIETCEGLL